MPLKNHLSISPTLATSGQPTAEQFQQIADEGFNTIINLAMATSDNAIANEGDIVTGLGMTYVHLPIIWESPKVEQFYLFADIMQSLQGKKVWVHCALNMRVSAFIYLYRTLFLGESKSAALVDLHKLWQPNERWQQFIEDCEQAFTERRS